MPRTKKEWKEKVKCWTDTKVVEMDGDTVACVLYMIASLPENQIKDLNEEMKKLGIHYN
ncbi:hypothetical protein JI723_14110 [Providencia manganoxydans]|uniref:Uncharacterized protein n=1 Tax=Providencia manganoxydans TaxID=2923283 RepID=A0ABX7ABZ9_9GAMM|nr:hypothetical protein [Providencia rettgeri]QQO61398.1 hypothetical protein JI723_14110 [Providencia manganoxydans]